jgi:translation initiation factor 2B subunit (eIF-2B alpha/beta/delta family)
MKKMPSGKLNKILNNKTLGSSELTHLLNKYFLSIRSNTPEIIKSIQFADSKLAHYQGVKSYLNELNDCLKKKDETMLTNFLKRYSNTEEEKVEIIFKRICPVLSKMRSIITLSRSGTLLGILKLWHQKNKNLKVVVCESRPMYEGRLEAMDLIKAGIKVELITDVMMGTYVPNVDTAIIGADVVLNNKNVVNKVGSRALALFCQESKKPFYVVTTRSKFSNRNSFKPKKENSKEVWNKHSKNLKVSNFYFEEVEKKLITKIFSD